MLDSSFFDIDAKELAIKLLGQLILRRFEGVWLKARIIETEAYLLNEKASHASIGYTYKRRALFETTGGMIYMYHSRAGASFNISAHGKGDAVLIKSAVMHMDNDEDVLKMVAIRNPIINRNGGQNLRQIEYLGSGQAILCRSLGLKINDWDTKYFDKDKFYIKDTGYIPQKIAVTQRLGIREDRDAHLPLRFVDYYFYKFATKSAKPILYFISQ